MFQQVIYQFKLTWRLLQDRRVPIWNKFIPFAALLYVLSPLDLIPDVIVGLGQLDDVGIVLLSMRLFERSVDPLIVEQHRADLDGRVPEGGIVIDTSDYTISSPESGGEKKKKR
jgi:uncharacterized membrane protein YkvA (DUF1232 family)